MVSSDLKKDYMKLFAKISLIFLSIISCPLYSPSDVYSKCSMIDDDFNVLLESIDQISSQVIFKGLRLYATEKKSDLVIFSYNRPLQLYALLESVEENISGLGTVSIIYRASDDVFVQAYEQVKNRFSSCIWYAQGTNPAADFKPLTERAIFQSPQAYILFAVDDIIVKDHIDIAAMIEALEKYRAYGFYLRMGKNLSECYPFACKQELPNFESISSDICMWQFNQGEYDWAYPHTVDMTLYRKKDIELDLRYLIYTTPNMLEARWAQRAYKIRHKKGLCYTQSKAVNLPLNRVQNIWYNRHSNYATPEELLAKFNEGLKIDIRDLHACNNCSAHMDYVPVFVRR